MQDTLTELMSSRICHDLISPVGAIGNGLDLITELSGTTPELDLVSQSAFTAQAKLKFFRIAFGASGDRLMSGAEAQRVAQEMFSAGRMQISFTESWGDRQRGLVKLLYLLLLCTESSLPRGGEMICTPTISGWEISVSGAPVKAPEELWNHVLHGSASGPLTAKNIQFSLARQSLTDQEISVTGTFTEDHLRLVF